MRRTNPDSLRSCACFQMVVLSPDFFNLLLASRDVHFRINKYSRIIPNLFVRIQNFDS